MELFNPNRHLKEQFVSNLTGSSKLELFLLLTNLSILILIRRYIGVNLISSDCVKKDDNAASNGKSLKAFSVVLTIDFFYIAVPYILFLTVLAEWTYWNTITVLVLLLLLRTFHRTQSSFLQEGGVDTVRATISAYRVSVIFPRRYAKTETYGTSLMDIGVGSFVIANALVSRQTRGISNMGLRDGFRSTSPLIILGFAQLISTSSVNYQVHVGEYGVHWNFFFTLAAVAILTLVINIHPHNCGLLGSFILVGYQALLLSGLNNYLLSEERKADIFSQNKEGILSIFGYRGMYLLGVRIGSYLFFGDTADAALKTKKWARTRVWALCLFFCMLRKYPVVRMAYVSFTLASNLQVLAILILSDYVFGCKNSALEEAFNRNMLASFLLANAIVLTGLVNLSIDTLSVSSISSLAILFAYAFILCFTVGFADFLGIKLNFW